jgi:hypothetical protein
MKRRGRPPKITGKKITGKPITGKKRGRPPKITDNKVIDKKITGKKRGRPPKITDKYITSNEDSPKTVADKDSKVVSVPLTPEQIEARRDKIRATIPKIDLHKVRDPINLIQNKKECAKHTEYSCHRPDVFLDYGCSQCSLAKACACPLKDLNRIPDGRAPKIKKFVMKKKISS